MVVGRDLRLGGCVPRTAQGGGPVPVAVCSPSSPFWASSRAEGLLCGRGVEWVSWRMGIPWELPPAATATTTTTTATAGRRRRVGERTADTTRARAIDRPGWRRYQGRGHVVEIRYLGAHVYGYEVNLGGARDRPLKMRCHG